jgi:hypothetical protein
MLVLPLILVRIDLTGESPCLPHARPRRILETIDCIRKP